ncbi:hypothetical protein [Bradyrhizobium sp. USDA 10063]
MAILPRRPDGARISSQSLDIDDRAPVIGPAIRQASGMELDGARTNGDKKDASIWRKTDTQALPPDVVIEVVKANDIDAVTRVSLDKMRTRPDEIDPGAALGWLYSCNLANGLLSFVTPRLRHPHELLAEKHAVVLERLADALSGAPEDSVRREGIVVLQQELRRLILLRQNRNSLVKG